LPVPPPVGLGLDPISTVIQGLAWHLQSRFGNRVEDLAQYYLDVYKLVASTLQEELGVIAATAVAQIDEGESLSANDVATEEAALGSVVDNKARDVDESEKTLENT
jgi:F0F1-type ATP synthase alpha subunit